MNIKRNKVKTVFTYLLAIIIILIVSLFTYKTFTHLSNSSDSSNQINTSDNHWMPVNYEQVKTWNNLIISDYDKFINYTPIYYNQTGTTYSFICKKNGIRSIISFSLKNHKAKLLSIKKEGA